MTEGKKISELTDLPEPQDTDSLEISTTSQATPESRSVRVDTLRGNLTDAGDVDATREAGQALIANSDGSAYINSRPILRHPDGRLIAAPTEQVSFSTSDPDYSSEDGDIFAFGEPAGTEFNLDRADVSYGDYSGNLFGLLANKGLEVGAMLDITSAPNNTLVGLWEVVDVDDPRVFCIQLSSPNGPYDDFEAFPVDEVDFDLITVDQPEYDIKSRAGETVLVPLRWDTEPTLPANGGSYQSEDYPELAKLYAGRTGYPFFSARAAVPEMPDTSGDVDTSPDDAYVAVAHMGAPYLTVIDTSDWSVVGGAPTLPGTGYAVAFSPDGAYLAVAHEDNPYLTVIDTSDWSVVGSAPALPGSGQGVAFSPNSAYLAVGHREAPYLTIIDTSNWSIVSGVENFPSSVDGGLRVRTDFSPDGNYLAVSTYYGSPYLFVFNTSDWSIVNSTPSLPGAGRDVAFSPDGGYLVAAHSQGDSLTVIDTSDWSTVPGPSYSNSNIRAIEFTNSGSHLVVAHQGEPYLTVYRASDWGQVNGTAAANNITTGIAFPQDDSYMVVTKVVAPYLMVIDPNPEAVEDSFTVPDLPSPAPGLSWRVVTGE